MGGYHPLEIEQYCGKLPHIVGNFVDENFLRFYLIQSKVKKGPFRFIYVGRLTALKHVQTIFDASKILKFKGMIKYASTIHIRNEKRQ